MKLTPRQYAAALYQAISEAAPKDQDKVIDNFAALLKENGDLGLFEKIEEEFRAIERESRGVRLAEVTTAHELSLQEEQALLQKLNDYVAGQVELRKQIDAGLIGGVVVKIGDELIDGSVKGQLRQLKSKLTE